ncbi:hypothetical protein HYV85_06265 [Candidatus Woesearchaeota archaeon]|nr:hypothetical protein [Candidatus Woesearchaeota archaeon]
MSNAGTVTKNVAEKSVAEYALDYFLEALERERRNSLDGRGSPDITYSLGAAAAQGRVGFQQKPRLAIAKAGCNITIFDIENSGFKLGTPENPVNSGIYRLGGIPERPVIYRAPMWQREVPSNKEFYAAVGEFLFGSNGQAAAFGQLGTGRSALAIMKALHQNILPPAEAKELLGRLKAEGINALEYLRN